MSVGGAEAMRTNHDTKSVESLVEVSDPVNASEFGVTGDNEGPAATRSRHQQEAGREGSLILTSGRA